MTNQGRADFLGDLGEFTTKSKSANVSTPAIEELADKHGFPSREPVRGASGMLGRRRPTERHYQVNFRVTHETRERLLRYAESERQPLGEVLRLALDALGAK